MIFTPDLIQLDRATVTRSASGENLFRDLSWQLRDGETWAIVGPVGSGKTALAEVLLGRHLVRSGSIRWPILEHARRAGRKAEFPADVIRLVAFKEESRLFNYGKHYYQERFNFTDPLEDLTVGEYLRAGVKDPEAAIEAVAERLGVARLLGNSFLTLSNGQVRRTRLARALLTHPELLILDDPFMGLDTAGRAEVAHLLGGLIAQGTRVLLITRPELIPDWVTHVLELDALTVQRQGPKLPRDIPPKEPSSGPAWQGKAEPPSGRTEPVLTLQNVTVRYGARTILDQVSWQVRRGERWALLGANGSGKSTLLSLVCGDHPQAYANEVRLFGQRRGSGESIWDVKRRIGLVSPELHLYFTHPMTAAEAAATGFADIVVPGPVTAEQRAIVRRLLAEFGLADGAERPFARLSTGQQRLVLLVRALVKRPELLILDEPFQGLDHAAIAHAKAWLDTHLTAEQTLVFVTHHAEELPRSVTRLLRLEAGRVVEQVSG